MDYFVELANTPDVHEAIVRDDENQRRKANEPRPASEGKEANGRNMASRLLLREFLREEHPAAWATEIIHAFYECPAFAARVWTQLRYCRASRLRLAEHQLREASGWSWNKTVPHLRIKPYVEMFGHDPDKAVHDCGLALDDPDAVDELLRRSGLYPEPPSFLRTLMQAEGLKEDQYDARTRELLEKPDNVRELARRLGLA